MLGYLRVLLSSLAVLGSVSLLAPPPLAAQEPTNWPEPFGNIVTPRSVHDDLSQKVSPQDGLGSPVKAVLNASRLGHYLIISAAVCWLPEGIKDVDLYNYGSAKVALFGVPGGTVKGTAQTTPFSKTFVLDLNDPGAAVLREAATLHVVQPGGQVQSIAVKELPASRD